ncbi:unnamed protein product, partial [Owenia fusiformis]
ATAKMVFKKYGSYRLIGPKKRRGERKKYSKNKDSNITSEDMTPSINLSDECDTNEYATTKEDTKYDITKEDTKDYNTKDDIIKNDNIKDEPQSFLEDEHNYFTTSNGSSSWVKDDHAYCAPDTEYKIKVEDVPSQPYDPEFPPEYWGVEDLPSQPYGSEFPPEYWGVEDVSSQPDGSEFPPEYCKVEDVSSQPYVPADFASKNCNAEDVQSQPYGPEFPTEYRELRDAIQLDACPGQFEIMRKSAMIKFIECYDLEPVTVKMSVVVTPDYLVKIRVHGQEIQSNHNIWEHIPQYTSSKEAIFKVLLELSQLHVCCGNPESEFTKHMSRRDGLGESTDRDNQEYIAFLETGFHTNCVHSKTCDLLIRNTCTPGSRALRCRRCQLYRNTLRKRKWRKENKSDTPSKFTSNQKLSHSDLVIKASKLQSEKTILKREVEILRRKLTAKGDTKAENVNLLQTSELPHPMDDSGDEIDEKLVSDSYRMPIGAMIESMLGAM